MMIKLRSTDGKIFQIEKKIINKSSYISNMIEDIGQFDDEIDTKCNEIALKKIIEYLEHYKDISEKELLNLANPNIDDILNNEEDIPFEKLQNINDSTIPEWLLEFFQKIELEIVFDVMVSADFLEITSLCEFISIYIASILKGKNSEEMAKILDIENDMNEDELKAAIERNKWLEEI